MNNTLTLLIVLLFTAISHAANKPVIDGKSFTGWEGDTKNTRLTEDSVLVAGTLEKPQDKRPTNDNSTAPPPASPP